MHFARSACSIRLSEYTNQLSEIQRSPFVRAIFLTRCHTFWQLKHFCFLLRDYQLASSVIFSPLFSLSLLASWCLTIVAINVLTCYLAYACHSYSLSCEKVPKTEKVNKCRFSFFLTLVCPVASVVCSSFLFVKIHFYPCHASCQRRSLSFRPSETRYLCKPHNKEKPLKPKYVGPCIVTPR